MLNQSVVQSDNLILRLKGNLASILYEILQNKLGNILTVIDATIADSEQRKAIKDLVKSKFWQDEYFSDQIKELLWQFDEVSGLRLINDSEEYRQLMDFPTKLVEKDDVDVPRTNKSWFAK